MVINKPKRIPLRYNVKIGITTYTNVYRTYKGMLYIYDNRTRVRIEFRNIILSGRVLNDKYILSNDIHRIIIRRRFNKNSKHKVLVGKWQSTCGKEKLIRVHSFERIRGISKTFSKRRP